MSWWPFKRPKTPEKPSRKTSELDAKVLEDSARRQDLFSLLELFLIKRVQSELELEEKRAEVHLKQAEYEAQTKLKIAELREQRRQFRATKMADRNRTAPRDARGRVTSLNGASGCAVCADPASPALTVDEIRFHHQAGHENGRQHTH